MILLLLLFQDGLGVLVERFRSEDPAVRAKATDDAIARWKDWSESDLAMLERLAKDPDPEVAGLAKESRVRIGRRRILGAAFLARVPDAESLLWSGSEEARIGLIRRVRERLPESELAAFAELCRGLEWKTRGAEAVEAAGSGVAWGPLLAGVLRAPDAKARTRAAEELGHRECRGFAADLIPLSTDADLGVAWAAVFALEKTGSREDAAGLLPLLKDGDRGVRLPVLHALGRLGRREHARALAPLLDDASVEVRIAAVEALGAFGAVEYADRVLPYLGDEDRDRRMAAIQALAGMGARAHAAKIAPLLKDRNPLVQWEAARALGRLGAKEFASDLVPFLKDDNARPRAVESLGLLGAEEVSGDLVPHLEDVEPGVRWRSIRALGQLEARAHAGAVVASLKDPDWAVRTAAAAFLGDFGSAEHAEALVSLLQEEQDGVADALAGIAARIPAARKRIVEALRAAGPTGELALVRLGESDGTSLVRAVLSEPGGIHREGVKDLLAALTWRHASPVAARLAVRVRTSGREEAGEELEALFRAAGLELERAPGAVLARRLPSDEPGVLASAFLGALGPETGFVAEGARVRLLPLRAAFEAWLKRLDAK
jgi:HEAT repeat protein